MKETRVEKIQRIMSARQKDVVLVLEDIHDPHNSAAILRTRTHLAYKQCTTSLTRLNRMILLELKGVVELCNKWLTFEFIETKFQFSIFNFQTNSTTKQTPPHQ